MNEKKDNELSELLDLLKVIVLTMIGTFIVLQFVQVSRVNGSSMENTYFQNNIVLIDKVFYKRQQPKRNDIIIVDYDDGLDDTLIIKRVIAVGGDHLDIINNEVYINGKKIKENYIKEKMDTEDLSVDIPKGKVFVMGDNRNHSLDSRKLGYFDFKDDVIGKVFFKIPF
ncbi:MAG: signal peptidase I [Bacillota bacterium]|nr:signal peptidase I [Bacillota bacterium]